MPAGWRRSKRCLGFTIANGRNMEILQDPQAPEGKRLVPTLGSVDWAENKGYEYQRYPISVFGLVLGCIEAKFASKYSFESS